MKTITESASVIVDLFGTTTNIDLLNHVNDWVVLDIHFSMGDYVRSLGWIINDQIRNDYENNH